MILRTCSSLLSAAVVVVASMLVAAAAWAAPINHGSYAGPTVSFNNITETTAPTDPTDPDELFGAPVGIADSIGFFPTAFTAGSVNGVGPYAPFGAIDFTSSQLQVEIIATAMGATIDMVTLTEFGDTSLTDIGVGTGATGASVSMSGSVTILSVGGVDVPVTPARIIPFTGVFDQDLFALPGDLGASTWIGSIDVDVAAVEANVTRVMLSLDNTLTASSEVGTSALIQKKVAGGLVITVPEPTSLALVTLGLLVASGFSRRRRA